MIKHGSLHNSSRRLSQKPLTVPQNAILRDVVRKKQTWLPLKFKCVKAVSGRGSGRYVCFVVQLLTQPVVRLYITRAVGQMHYVRGLWSSYPLPVQRVIRFTWPRPCLSYSQRKDSLGREGPTAREPNGATKHLWFLASLLLSFFAERC